MVAVHLIAHAAQLDESGKAILAQLHNAGATSAARAIPLHLDEEKTAALKALQVAGTVHEAVPGRYYVEDKAAPSIERNWGFAILLALLVLVSVGVSAMMLVFRP